MSRKSKKDNEFQKGVVGEFVSIDGDSYHVFVKGQGEDALVFMAGEGVPSPVLDFKPLWSLLTDNFKIVVLEKAGYGFSDITNNPSDIDTLVHYNREMLKKLNISPPYILVAHSYGGLEALHWAQKYSDEIKSIISLDMTIPSIVDITRIPLIMKLVLLYSSIFKNTKISKKRAIKLTEKLPSFNHPSLTDHDRETYLQIIRNRFMTTNMVKELKMMTENANIIRSKPYLANLPILFFSSDLIDAAKNAGKNPSELLQLHKDFLSNFHKSKHINLDCNHFIHAYYPDKIAQEITAFINELNIPLHC